VHDSDWPIHERAVPASDRGSRRGLLDEPVRNVWDDAVMESFFSSLKTERNGAKNMYRTRDDAKADVFDYIERSTIRNAGTRPSNV
jgi:transposase InsO family protein